MGDSQYPLGADKFIHKLDGPLASQHATQRYQRGFSDIDMWNFDIFIADTIAAGCQWYIDNSHLCPWGVEISEWKSILEEIRDGFASRDANDEPNVPKKAWKLLRNNFTHLWD